MRSVLGLVSLLVVLAVVSVLVRKQMTAVHSPMPALQTPAGRSSAPATGNVAQQSQHIQQQYKQAIEGAMQARPMPDD